MQVISVTPLPRPVSHAPPLRSTTVSVTRPTGMHSLSLPLSPSLSHTHAHVLNLYTLIVYVVRYDSHDLQTANSGNYYDCRESTAVQHHKPTTQINDFTQCTDAERDNNDDGNGGDNDCDNVVMMVVHVVVVKMMVVMAAVVVMMWTLWMVGIMMRRRETMMTQITADKLPLFLTVLRGARPTCRSGWATRLFSLSLSVLQLLQLFSSRCTSASTLRVTSRRTTSASSALTPAASPSVYSRGSVVSSSSGYGKQGGDAGG